MNLRQTAALVPVAWYLITPPTVLWLGHPDKHVIVTDKASLNTWRRVENPFPSEADCQAEKKAFVDASCGPNSLLDCRIYSAAQCVRADDPRLIGWYMIAPPEVRKDKSSFAPDDSAPLSRWSLIGTFDSADQCRAQRDQIRTDALCVTGDDPRLKVK
jgi:hypothetical protein